MNRNNYHLNPTASHFKSAAMSNIHEKQNGTLPEMTPPSSTYLEARVDNLEEEYANLRTEVGTLKEKYNQLRLSVEKEKEAGRVKAEPLVDARPDSSHKTVAELGRELEELTLKTRALTNSEPVQKPVQTNDRKTTNSVPPHLRTASTAIGKLGSNLIPPHLRKASKPDGTVASK
jgi:hypothetical protein